MILFCDRSCPYAHRVHALIAYLDWPLDVRECLVGGEKPAELRRYSANERLPLLVDGDLRLTTSRVMLEHLAERFGLPDAFPDTLAHRSLHREAMVAVDGVFAPVLVGKLDLDDGDPRIGEFLDLLEQATATVAPGPNLLTLHVAPMWVRFRRWLSDSAMARAVERREALRAWLDAAIEVECVRQTTPDEATGAEDWTRAQQAGLMPTTRSKT